jgi:two-component sensor histidine kinase
VVARLERSGAAAGDFARAGTKTGGAFVAADMAVAPAPVGADLWPRKEVALPDGLQFQAAVVRVGLWLGWAALAGLLADLLIDPAAKDRPLALLLVSGGGVALAAATFIPWREWLVTRRGRLLLDLWSAGLIAFVALLVVSGGPAYALLLFLASPFIAVVNGGWRRPLWLTVNAGACVLAAALVPLPAGPTALRLALVAAAVAAVLLITRALRREIAARAEAAARADLERALLSEANHRIKNSLQVVSDLLLLSRPRGSEGSAFDEAAARVHSIAVVHRLLAESGGDAVDAAGLLSSIAGGLDGLIRVEADPIRLDPGEAQKLGIVANELITNAVQHGLPPVEVKLAAGPPIALTVDDHGRRRSETAPGLGLRLVTRTVEGGLRGRFELTTNPAGGTRAHVTVPGRWR